MDVHAFWLASTCKLLLTRAQGGHEGRWKTAAPWFSRLNHGGAAVERSLDLGLSGFPAAEAVLHGAEEVTMAQRFWSLDAVKTKLWPHQRLLAVPGTFACDQGQYQSIAEAQSQVLTKLRGYAAWAKTDSRLIGMWPWHWTNRTKSQNGGPCDMELGCEAMPGCVSELRALGRSVPRNDSSLLLSSGRGNGS